MAVRHQRRPPLDRRIRRNAHLAPALEPITETLRRRHVVGDPREHERLERRPGADTRELVIESVERERDAGVTHREVVRDLVGRREWMDHRGDRAELGGGVEGDDPLRAGRHRDRYPAARSESVCGEGSGAAVDGLHELRVAESRVEEVDRDCVRSAARGSNQRFVKPGAGVVESRRDVAVEREPRPVGRRHGHGAALAAAASRPDRSSNLDGSSR